MAALSLDIGSFHVEVTASDDAATDVVTEYAEAMGIEGTNYEKGIAILQSFVRLMVETSDRHKREAAAIAARRSVDNAATVWE